MSLANPGQAQDVGSFGHDVNQGRNVTDCHWFEFFSVFMAPRLNNESSFMVFEATLTIRVHLRLRPTHPRRPTIPPAQPSGGTRG